MFIFSWVVDRNCFPIVRFRILGGSLSLLGFFDSKSEEKSGNAKVDELEFKLGFVYLVLQWHYYYY